MDCRNSTDILLHLNVYLAFAPSIYLYWCHLNFSYIQSEQDLVNLQVQLVSEIKHQVADNVAAILFSAEQAGGTGKGDVLNALDSKYDALRDKLLMEALMNQVIQHTFCYPHCSNANIPCTCMMNKVHVLLYTYSWYQSLLKHYKYFMYKQIRVYFWASLKPNAQNFAVYSEWCHFSLQTL